MNQNTIKHQSFPQSFRQSFRDQCFSPKTSQTRRPLVVSGTDFTVKALGGKESIELPEKTKKVYNILGDYPDVVAAHLVKGMLENTKNNAHIEWLTTQKAAWRFMTAAFNKRDFFSGK